MVSGHKTLNEIEKSIADLRRREQALGAELEQQNKEHASLLDQRTGAFRELAEVRVNDALSDGVIDRADQLHHRIEGALKARQKTIDEFKAREATNNDKRGKLVWAARDLRTEIKGLEKKLDEVAEKARKQLASEDAYRTLKAQSESAEQVFQEADAKTKRAESDRARKGEAYEHDPLFMYLWERKYGLSEYRAGSLVKMVDDWVADLVDYHEARANYSMLKEIPTRLREHCDGLAAQSKELQEKLDAMEAERIKELAGADLLATLEDVRRRQAENTNALERVDAELVEVNAQLRRYAEGSDPSFKEAVALSAEFLESESMQELMQLARSTVEPTDDQIVARISQIDDKVGEVKEQISKSRIELKQLMERREELVKVAANFRRNHYDDPGSEFFSDDFVQDLLQEVLRGAISGADYWSRGQRRHQWSGRAADPFRKQAGLPPFGRGWGRGSGGDFRTGGGF